MVQVCLRSPSTKRTRVSVHLLSAVVGPLVVALISAAVVGPELSHGPKVTEEHVRSESSSRTSCRV